MYQKMMTLSTEGFCDVINITDDLEAILGKSNIKLGLMNIFVPGATAGVTAIEYEDGCVEDFRKTINRLVPEDGEYEHNKKWGDGNGFSHVRASLIGPSLTVPIKDGRPETGTWQQIVVADFDNRSRERKVIVTVLPA